ncbi:MAG: Ig-like domain-containing protein, partial [Clostridia bacterium]|nr:Ig-like domain-containing protein [Clostridia bacterium]
MRRNKKRKTILVMLLLILFSLISIGYATLTANVSTSGGATVKAIRWTAYFDNINETPGSVTANSAPTTNGIRTTELNWTVSMDTPGQFYEFTVDVVNIGRRDAMVESLVDTTLVAPQSNYFNYTVTYIDDIPIEQYDKLPANSTDTLKIRIEFRTDIAPENLPETAQEISLTYPSNYVEADSNAKARDKSISVAIIKVDGTAVGNNNVTVYEGYTSDISIDNSEGMENITYSSSDTSVATVNSSGTITGVGCGTATITLTGAKSGKTKTFTVEVKKPIGSPVNYSTTLNGQTLSNWKVFYVDGDYTYIILDDYLPNAAVSNDVRTTYNLANGNGTYSIKSTTNRTDLINAMTTTSNWAELINNGEMNGTALSSAVKSDANVIAKGA